MNQKKIGAFIAEWSFDWREEPCTNVIFSMCLDTQASSCFRVDGSSLWSYCSFTFLFTNVFVSFYYVLTRELEIGQSL